MIKNNAKPNNRHGKVYKHVTVTEKMCPDEIYIHVLTMNTKYLMMISQLVPTIQHVHIRYAFANMIYNQKNIEIQTKFCLTIFFGNWNVVNVFDLNIS